jgi:glycosyltransferase involved in cell wall biosynthesis
LLAESTVGGPLMDQPVLSVLTVAGVPEALRATYASLTAQADPRWQWSLVRDGGVPADIAADPRVVAGEPTTAGPADDLAAALRGATGRHVLVLAPGDLLSPAAVEAVSAAIGPQEWGYTDEEQRFPSGRTPDVWRKPAYSPERLRSQPYAVRSAVLPRSVLDQVGGIRPEAATAAWYDAVLRVSEVAGPGILVPRPHVVRTDPRQTERLVPGPAEDFTRVVREHCTRTGIAVDDVMPVVVQGRPVGQRVRRRMSRRPTVSVIVPTRGGTSVVRGRERRHVVELARSMWVEGRYPDLELVVVHDAETPPEVLDELRDIVGADLVLRRFEGPFDFSRKCNVGALTARGEYLCFLNDDMEIGDPDWLEVMATHLEDPGVGGVGARLVFADGSLQHVGHEYDGGGAGHPLFGWRASTLALGAAAHVAGERSGVTAACLLVRAADFVRLGGFSEQFPLNYNDVDLCLKLREDGFRIIYTPHAELTHFESQSRVPRILRSEAALLTRRWAYRTAHEAYLRQAHPVRIRIKFLPPEPDAGPLDVPCGLPPVASHPASHVAEETHD